MRACELVPNVPAHFPFAYLTMKDAHAIFGRSVQSGYIVLCEIMRVESFCKIPPQWANANVYKIRLADLINIIINTNYSRKTMV